MGRLRTGAVCGVLALAGMTCALGLAESVLRIWDPIGIAYVREASRYFGLMSRSGSYAYIHRPNLNVVLQGVHVRTNTLGFRGPEVSPTPIPGTRRVLVLGDSVVFGWGVEESDSPTAQLAKILAGAELHDVEIVPVGVGSWNTRTEYEYMRAKGFDLKPDLIVLVVVQNDLEPKSRGDTFVPLDVLRAPIPGAMEEGEFFLPARKWLSDSFLLAAWFERWVRTKKSFTENQYYTRNDSPQALDAMNALEGLARDARLRGIDLIAYLHGAGKTAVERSYLELYGEKLSELGVPWFVFPSEIYEARHQNSLIDPHQNASGISIMMQSMLPQIAARIQQYEGATQGR